MARHCTSPRESFFRKNPRKPCIEQIETRLTTLMVVMLLLSGCTLTPDYWLSRKPVTHGGQKNINELHADAVKNFKMNNHDCTQISGTTPYVGSTVYFSCRPTERSANTEGKSVWVWPESPGMLDKIFNRFPRDSFPEKFSVISGSYWMAIVNEKDALSWAEDLNAQVIYSSSGKDVCKFSWIEVICW